MGSMQTAAPCCRYLYDRPRALRARFKVRHMMISNVRGEFHNVSATRSRFLSRSS